MRVEPSLPPVVGTYLATVTVPTAGLLTLATGGTLPGVVTLVGVWGAVAVVGSFVAAGVSDLADAVGTAGVGTAATLAPLTFLPVMLSVPPASRTAVLAGVGLASGLVGLTMATLGWTVRNRRRRTGATEWYSVTVGESEGLPTWIVFVAGVVPVGLLLLVGFLLGELDGGLPTTLVTTLGSLGAFGSWIGDDETTVAVTDEGVATDGWLRGAETIDGYDLDDEEFRLHRGGLAPTVSVECDDLDDAERDRLRAALDRLLDDGSGRSVGDGSARDGRGVGTDVEPSGESAHGRA